MIQMMEENNIQHLRKKINNELCEFDYIVINKKFDNYYNIKKYNGLGNKFELDIYSWIKLDSIYDWLDIYSNSKITFKTHNTFKKFLNRYKNNENVFFEESKYEMKMSKHNIDFNNSTVFQSH